MAEMNPTERIQAVLGGEKPDRPPVGFWHHFPADAVCGQPAVDAHLDHLNRYDLDFLKIMNDNPYPTRLDVRRAADLRDIPILSGTEDEFTAQLDLIEALADELDGRVPLVTTIFSSWSVLRKIVTPPTSDAHLPPSFDSRPADADVRLSEILAEDRTLVGMALEAISQSLANFVRRCLKAGADGIFLSVREDRVNNDANGPNTYKELARDGDRQILSVAAEGTMNMLHLCGVPKNIETFAAYPIHVINWADRAAGPARPIDADVRLSEILAEDRTLVGMALEAISQSLANFVRRCLKAGADGIFLSVREDRVNNDANGPNTYKELARDGDRQILSVAAEGTMNMLHLCGVPKNIETFAAYPIHVINWADRAAGPAIKDVIDRIEPVVCAGVDNLKTLPEGTPAQVMQEVGEALQQAGERPMIVSPGCTYDPETVPPENLKAMAQAVRG